MTEIARMTRKLIGTSRRAFRAFIGQDLFVRTDTKVSRQRFGSAYGGWDIALEGIGRHSVVYSVGIGEDATFDMALIERFGLVVHAFDPTPKSIKWVQRQRFPVNFVFHPYGVADIDGEISFNPPENPEHVSHTILERPSTAAIAITVPVKTVKTIMSELGHHCIDILKMDIEGAEFRVLHNVLISGLRPGQILVEFHHRFPGAGVPKAKECIEQLRRCGYRVFSVSDSGEDLCFIHQSQLGRQHDGS
jgi:FkbM family methyltransferase